MRCLSYPGTKRGREKLCAKLSRVFRRREGWDNASALESPLEAGGSLACLSPVSRSRLDVSLAPNQRSKLLSWEELMASVPGPQGSLIMLWAGEDPALHSSLVEELEAAGIPFVDKPTGDDEVAPTADTLPIDWKARFGFEVAVPSSNLAAAEKILEKLLDLEPADMELSADDSLEPDAAALKPSHL